MQGLDWMMVAIVCFFALWSQSKRPIEGRARYGLAMLLAALAAWLDPRGWLGFGLGMLGVVQLLPLIWIQLRLPVGHPHLQYWIRYSIVTPQYRQVLLQKWLEHHLLRYRVAPSAPNICPDQALIVALVLGQPLPEISLPEVSPASVGYSPYQAWAAYLQDQPLPELWAQLLHATDPEQVQRAALALGVAGEFWRGRALLRRGSQEQRVEWVQQGAELMLAHLNKSAPLYAWRRSEAEKNLARFGLILEEPRLAVPYVTYALLALIALMFVLEMRFGGVTSVKAMLLLGGNYGPLTVDGQYWRMITAIFLHAGWLHIGFNSYYMWSLGRVVEHQIGHRASLFVFVLSGIMGSWASLYFAGGQSVSVGASGAMFGWMAFYYTFSQAPWSQRLRIWQNAAPALAVPLFLGFLIPGIDGFAHLGGLLCGLLLSAVYRNPTEGEKNVMLLATVAALAWAYWQLIMRFNS